MFDNDDKLKELEEAEVVYCSPETLENIRSKQFLDGRSVDWNCYGQIILLSAEAGKPNLGLSMFPAYPVPVKGFISVITSRDGSVDKPRSMLNIAIFDPWQRPLFSRQQTPTKKSLC